jgi:hypothetical protein
MRALEIFDADERGRLAGTLQEVLTLSDPPASGLAWTLRFIETPDDVSRAWPKGLKDLESAASSRRFGLELTWKELLALAAELKTPVDIRLDGWERAPKAGDGPETLQLRVEVLDATLFRVAARDRRVLSVLAKRFQDTREVELSEMF